MSFPHPRRTVVDGRFMKQLASDGGDPSSATSCSSADRDLAVVTRHGGLDVGR